MIRHKDIIDDESREMYTYVRLYMIIDDLIASMDEGYNMIRSVDDVELTFLSDLVPLLEDLNNLDNTYNDKIISLDKITKLIENICINHYFNVNDEIKSDNLENHICNWTCEEKVYHAIDIAGRLTGNIITLTVTPTKNLKRMVLK